MLKIFLSVLAGALTGAIVVFAGDYLSHLIYAPPANFDFNNQEALQAYAESIPTHVFAIMLCFWLLSSFSGGFVAGKINPQGWQLSALLTGLLLLAGAASNFYAIPHPLWMMVAAVILYLPAAWLGGKLANPN